MKTISRTPERASKKSEENCGVLVLKRMCCTSFPHEHVSGTDCCLKKRAHANRLAWRHDLIAKFWLAESNLFTAWSQSKIVYRRSNLCVSKKRPRLSALWQNVKATISVSFSWRKASALRIRWWEDWEEKIAEKKKNYEDCRDRKFLPQWLETFPWLTYKEDSGLMFCKVRFFKIGFIFIILFLVLFSFVWGFFGRGGGGGCLFWYFLALIKQLGSFQPKQKLISA